ncbi:MAG: glycosyltransferase family 4 protein [Candidatus Anstonellales archaeon]
MKIGIIGLFRGFKQGIRGGPERVMKNTITGICKYSSAKNKYLFFAIGFNESNPAKNLTSNVHVVPCKEDLSQLPIFHFHWLRIKKMICDKILSESPDLIVIHDPVFFNLLSRNTKNSVIVFLHGAFWKGLECQYLTRSMLHKFLYYRFLQIPFNFQALKRARLIVAITDYIKSNIPKFLYNKTIVLENPVEDDFFNYSEKRKLYKKCDEKIRIISVGRYDPRKNYEVLLYAVKKLIKMKPEYKNRLLVKIIGSEYKSFRWYFYKIKHLIDVLELGKNIELLRSLNDEELLIQYSQADIYLHTSLYEGLPNAVQEAMSMGIPVISSNVGGIPSVIKNGYNGFLFNPSKTKILAMLIDQMCSNSDLRSIMGENAKKTAYSRWALSRYITSLEKLFKIFV